MPKYLGQYINDADIATKKNVDESAVVIDSTLSISGQAADAKATGDAITETQSKMGDIFYKVKNFTKIQKVKDYLYEIWYEDIDYDNAYAYYKTHADIPTGACSSVRNGNFYGRNFDWIYDNRAEFVVHTPSVGGRYASIGVANGLADLTNAFVESGAASDSYKIVPFQLLDGVNEYGVAANTNVVPTDGGENYVIPTETSEVEIYGLMLVRYILDNFKSATEAVDYIQKHMTVYFSTELHDLHYELHLMVVDRTKSYLVEFVDNATVVIDMTEGSNSTLASKPYMTNFLLNGVVFNADGGVYTPETKTATENAMVTNLISENGSGLERYNLIVGQYDTANTKSGMRALMNALKYTHAYSTSTTPSDPYWYTEFVGNGINVASNVSAFADIVAASGQQYLDRNRNTGLTWQTCHSAVYDLDATQLSLVVQEDGQEIEYILSVGYTKLETDTLLNAKQNTISDLETIRSGAALGATAVQDVSGLTARLVGNGAPTSSTVGAVGDLYTDTTTGKMYHCTAVASGVYTWEELGAGGGGSLPMHFSNKTVAVSAWTADTTFTDYPYKADITCTGVTADMFADVVFSPADSATGNYSSVCTTGANAITIYAKDIPSAAVSLPTIIAWEVAE